MDVQSERSKSAEAIGPYRIIGRLGAGGMGEVFLAYDGRLDRRVAIKRIRPEAGARPERRERFRREARMAARLSHPAIVQVYDILQENGLDYIVMEYVEGESLREKVARGPLAVRQVLALARELADGLEAAHQQGIVHRDLKSENVLVTPSGRPKVTDFGIAKLLLAEEGEESLTADDAVIGTCRSMSPEQARGEAVDHRTDLFALGVLLYEMLTGTSPFAAENRLATLNRVIHSRQRPVRELAPAVPEELSRLVDHLLVKEPRLRPQSAGQVRRELERLALATADGGGEASDEISPPTASSELPTVEGSEIATVLQPIERSTAETPQRDSALSTAGVLPRRWMSFRRLAAALALASLLVAVFSLLVWHRGELIHVAVLRPEVGGGAGDPGVELLGSALRVALLRSLLSLEGISTLPPEYVDEVSGSPSAVARAMAADEMVAARLDCGKEICQVTLSRIAGQSGALLWAQSFEAPVNRPYLLAEAVEAHLKHGYPERSARRGFAGREVRSEDYLEFLRLQQAFEKHEEAGVRTDELLARLEILHRRSPRFLEAMVFAAEVFRYRFQTRRDPADLERALDLLRRARELAPEDPRPLQALFDTALKAEELDQAEEAVRALERLQPADPLVLRQRARLLERRGEAGPALRSMREAVRRHPSWHNLFWLAAMESRQGEGEAARRHLQELLERFPRYYAAESLLAEVELASGSPAKAAEIYADLVNRSPQIGELSNLGLAYLLLRRYPEAEARLEQALALEPANPLVALNLADVLLLEGKHKEAHEMYSRVLELIERDPGASHWQLRTVRAQALAHLGRRREAVQAIQPVLGTARDNAQAAYEVSLVYALVGDRVSELLHEERSLALGMEPRWFGLPWFDSLKP